jgi:folylpolyglutamate synthase/dihydrofolate synthase
MRIDPASILERLKRLHPRVIDLSLDRVLRLLDRLGNPHERMPPVVHVAGTNGKGSTVAFLRSMLAAHGRTAHVYTSPHLVRFNERIVVAGSAIDDLRLSALLDRCERVNDGQPITFFEITTAAAFLAFAETPADYTLLETGLGGRLDATNVVARPALTVITPVSIDHRSYLGDTIEAIAAEKAGILKSGVAAVVTRQEPGAMQAITARAAVVGAGLVREGTDWTVAAGDGGMRWDCGDRSWVLPAPALPGAHQLQNAGTALAALAALPGIEIDRDNVASGLGRVHWPARLQRLDGNRAGRGLGRLARLLPDGWELWLDGGHNPGAATVLAAQLEHWRDRPRYAVIGMLQTKDADGFIAPLAGCLDAVVAIAIPDEPASFDAGSLAALIGRHHTDATTAESLERALDRLSGRPGPARVLICGSLYLAGHVLAADATD